MNLCNWRQCRLLTEEADINLCLCSQRINIYCISRPICAKRQVRFTGKSTPCPVALC
jgi:hypothetical protein